MGDDKIIPVRVAVRIRPINRKENNEGCQIALDVVENEPQVGKLIKFIYFKLFPSGLHFEYGEEFHL